MLIQTLGGLGSSSSLKLPLQVQKESPLPYPSLSLHFASLLLFSLLSVFSLSRSIRRRDSGERDFVSLQFRPLMGFVSFIGRVLFASVFILSAWQEFNEFGVDGGPAAKALKPKYDVFTNHITSNVGVQVPEIEIKHVVTAAIALKGIGGILFIFGSSLGAHLLLLHQLIATPILYDFYNYDMEKKEFMQLFVKFTESLALLGALLFFLGMKNYVLKRQPKKKAAPKTKTT